MELRADQGRDRVVSGGILKLFITIAIILAVLILSIYPLLNHIPGGEEDFVKAASSMGGKVRIISCPTSMTILTPGFVANREDLKQGFRVFETGLLQEQLKCRWSLSCIFGMP